MAHNIDLSNGRANIAYTGETPWHGLGVAMPAGAAVDAWRAAAGLDFIVKKSDSISFQIGDSSQIFPRTVATYREDTGAGLGLVDKNYKIVQPAEVIEFFDSYTKAGDMHLECAGSLRGGRRVWALARHDMEIRVGKSDIVRPYFLLTTSFDGKTGTIGTFTTTRVVCNNTLNIVYKEVAEGGETGHTSTGFSIPHFSTFNADAAKDHVGKLVKAAQQFEQSANKMAATPMDDESARRMFVGLVGQMNSKGTDLTKGSREKAEALFWLYKNGPGAELEGARSTVWGALNAVTRYVDHMSSQRADGGRLDSAWYGTGKTLKAKALEEAEHLAAGDFARLLGVAA